MHDLVSAGYATFQFGICTTDRPTWLGILVLFPSSSSSSSSSSCNGLSSYLALVQRLYRKAYPRRRHIEPFHWDPVVTQTRFSDRIGGPIIVTTDVSGGLYSDMCN